MKKKKFDIDEKCRKRAYLNRVYLIDMFTKILGNLVKVKDVEVKTKNHYEIVLKVEDL